MSTDSAARAVAPLPVTGTAGLHADSPVVRSIGGAMIEADAAHRRLRTAFASSIGLSALEFTALVTVGETEGITPKVLATSLDITTGAVTAMTDRLVGADLVVRAPNPHDRRSVLLALTPTGERAYASMSRQYFEALARAISGSSGVSSEIVTGLLQRTAEAIDETAAAIEGTPTIREH